MPTSISVAELAQRLHATDQPVLRLDFEAGTVVTDDRPAQGYALAGDAIVFESLAERNRHVAEFVYEELRERLTDAPSLLYERGHGLWRCEIGHADQASGRLMAIAARQLDILALGSERIRQGANVFDVLHLIEQQHAACLAGMLTSLPHRTPLALRLDKQRLDALEPAGLLFLARRMLGYVYDRAQITSMALSMRSAVAPHDWLDRTLVLWRRHGFWRC